jgi:Leucine-rich repeat (LRR) protein
MRKSYILMLMGILLVASCGEEAQQPPKALTYQQLMFADRYESIDEAISHRDSVYKLILINKSMETLPSKVGKLYTLNTLELTYNKLTDLPRSIANLSVLQSLYA